MIKVILGGLFLTLFLPVIYALFEGYDNRVDLFLFVDFEQKLKWYAHYTAYHLENIVKTFLIYYLINKNISNDIVRKIAFSFVILSIFRLVEYWLFRHHIPFLPIFGIILAYSFMLWLKRH